MVGHKQAPGAPGLKSLPKHRGETMAPAELDEATSTLRPDHTGPPMRDLAGPLNCPPPVSYPALRGQLGNLTSSLGLSFPK